VAGEQMDTEAPRRWLLISREMAVPAEEGGSGRWAIDHLFLDQHGVPTLIEVKRATDSRSRREVVGQMLDYAANAVVYWPVEDIRARYEAALSGPMGALNCIFIGCSEGRRSMKRAKGLSYGSALTRFLVSP
jgi:hypothetical protein